MFLSSAHTTVNLGMDSKNTVTLLMDCIRNLKVHGETQFIEIQTDTESKHYVYGFGEGPETRIKPFFNPVELVDGDDTYLIIDIRTCTRWDRTNEKPVVNNISLFRREVVRVLLENVWLQAGPNDILNLGAYQINVFATWVSEMIARKFALDAEQQLRVLVLAAFYYLCLFKVDELDSRRAIPAIIKACNVNANFAIETLNGVEFIADIEGLVNQINETLQTERLVGFDIQVMIAMLSGSWFGANNAKLVGIALEFPPTWNALMYLSLTDRAHRENGIAKVARRKERDNGTRDYVASVSRMLMQESDIDPKTIRGGL